jgi:hypothetical protein
VSGKTTRGAAQCLVRGFDLILDFMMTDQTIYPPNIDPRLPEFLPRFFRISDDKDGAAEYPNLFTSDASFQFTSIRMEGTEGNSPHTIDSQG